MLRHDILESDEFNLLQIPYISTNPTHRRKVGQENTFRMHHQSSNGNFTPEASMEMIREKRMME
jgi:hypothetical protein